MLYWICFHCTDDAHDRLPNLSRSFWSSNKSAIDKFPNETNNFVLLEHLKYQILCINRPELQNALTVHLHMMSVLLSYL